MKAIVYTEKDLKQANIKRHRACHAFCAVIDDADTPPTICGIEHFHNERTRDKFIKEFNEAKD